MTELNLKITGLDCVDCAKGLEGSVASLPGVEKAELSFFDGIMTISGTFSEDEVRRMITRMGYGVAADESGTNAPAAESNAVLGFWRYLLQSLETRLALIAGGVVLLSLLSGWLGLPPWAVVALQIGALMLAGWPIARNGVMNLWINHTFNINFLMTLAGIGAVVIGEYAEAASLILLFDLAEALEGYTNERARGALTDLRDLSPTHAIKLHGDHEHLVRVEELAIGDWILVRAGDRIPADGVIVDGQSDINQAPITGESLPVWKAVDDEVFSGTVNGSGQLVVQVTRLTGDSTLNRIIQMVTEAQSRQSRSQKFIDKFAQYYTPAMVVLAVLMAVIPPLFFGEPFLNPADGSRGWLQRALVLLVISCPCALVISTPVTMVASLTRAAKEGVLFKGGIFVEQLSKIGAFAFDKTGTLTTGEPQVVESRDLDCIGDTECAACDDLVALAYALERHSTHPLAQAIRDEAEKRHVLDRYPAAERLTTRGGLGLEGQVNGRLMTIGSLRLFEAEHEVPQNVHRWVEQAETGGRTAMLLCDGDHVRGFLAVADTLRDDAQAVVRQLNDLHKHTVMLTGDNATVAAVMAQQVGLLDVRANLLPGDKQEAVSALRAEYGSVAMVGDGINDAPALASADLGIAMGGSGSAQAMETADVVLMADDLNKLPFAIRLSQFANRLVRQNIVFSIGVKLLVMVIAFLGYAPLWMAVMADMGVSLLVTLNGLRAMHLSVQS
ncbi:MAG: cation-translocating P-type ATPase [Anaerolineaceae bacterium]|nr:cation-translocating P-type ATPase [Anaerolineaceae bacterium]